jgi:glycosyltransferase involved in cell wall biosynthesis
LDHFLGDAVRDRWLFKAAYSPFIIQPVILASYVDEESDQDEGEGIEVVRCWEQGKTDYLVELAAAVEQQELNAVMIQFNYGFFDFERLRPFILELVSKGVSVFMTLHSTLDQSDVPSFCLETLLPALRMCRRLFVHSIHDVRRLAQMGLVENVVLMPHGVPAVESVEDCPERQNFTIASYGFALPGKGLSELVEAVSLLEKAGENPRLIMVNAHYDDQDGLSTDLLESLEQSIDKFELADSIEMHTGFLRDEESLALISQADVVVFPYTKTGESGSGAVRLGLVSGRIVATTPLPIFDDVKEAVYQFPGESAQHIAQGLKALRGKMAAQDTEITHLRERTKRLVRATQYSGVSRFLDERMKTDIYLNCFTESFRLDREKISLQNATWVRDRIVSKGSGLICYGPYAPLAPGSYRVMVKGTLRTGQEQATLRFGTADEAFATVDLRPGKDDTLCDFLVFIQKAVQAVELVVEMRGTGVLTISDYMVARSWR